MKVLVIGDSCVDEFVYGDIKRISPEAPIPVFLPTHEESNDGMAQNVSNNIQSLGVESHIITNAVSLLNGLGPLYMYSSTLGLRLSFKSLS